MWLNTYLKRFYIKYTEGAANKSSQILSRKEKRSQAFFISLVAATEKGFPTKEDYLFDVATRLEMLGYDVAFLCTQDLHDLFFIEEKPARQRQRQSEGFNIYQLLHFLVEDNANSSFFIDELPFIISVGKQVKHLLSFFSDIIEIQDELMEIVIKRNKLRFYS